MLNDLNPIGPPFTVDTDYPRPELSARLVVLGWMTVALYIFVKATNELQKVYLLFGTLRSPFYSDKADGSLAHRDE